MGCLSFVEVGADNRQRDLCSNNHKSKNEDEDKDKEKASIPSTQEERLEKSDNETKTNATAVRIEEVTRTEFSKRLDEWTKNRLAKAPTAYKEHTTKPSLSKTNASTSKAELSVNSTTNNQKLSFVNNGQVEDIKQTYYCQCHQLLATSTTKSHKSNTFANCPNTIDEDNDEAWTTTTSTSTTRTWTANNLKHTPAVPLITASISTTTTTLTPTNIQEYSKQNGNNKNVEKTQNAANPQLQEQFEQNHQNKQQQPRPVQPQPYQQQQSLQTVCLHSYRNASMATRNMAVTMAAACSNCSYTVQEMLGYACDIITTRLIHVSSKLIDNFGYYAETAAVAATRGKRNANTKLQYNKKRHSKNNKKKTKNNSNNHCKISKHMKYTQNKCHCTRLCCQHDTSQFPPISTISTNLNLSKLSPSPSSSLSSSSLLLSSPSVECRSCGISASPSASAVSATTTSSSEFSLSSSSLAATTAAMAHASSTAAAAYNYIGYNYYNLLRNTINLYAASSVILVLCYLTTTTSAAATNSYAAPLETHPIVNIDWSKFDESSSDKEILDMLLEKKRYDKRLLPPVNGTLTVNVNVLLLSLASPDESSLKYEVEFLLNQQWNDPRLQYGNKSHYDFLNALHHHDSIWTPDTYFIMHGDFKDPIIPMHFALRIYRNGTITYAMRRHLILSCQGSLHIFPFDDPKCSFSMESISYEVAQIKYVWKNDEDTLRKSPSLTTLNAYLIKNATTACEQTSWRGNYSCLRVDLIFTRDRAFYFTTVFIPGIILVTSSFITFWLEWNAVPARSMIGNYSCLQVALTFTRDRAYYFTTVFIPGIILVTSSFITFWLEWNAVPARVMIGVTTMLNFFTTSNGFRSTLPVVSNLTAMNVWDGVCMCFIYASLLEFVCVNYVGRKRPLHNVVYRPGENPVTQRLPAVLSRIGVILASPLEIIEREFQTALSSEKAAAGLSSGGTTMPQTPTSATSHHIHWDRHCGGSMIGTAVKNLRARSMRRRCDHQRHFSTHYSQQQQQHQYPYESRSRTEPEHIYAETSVCVDSGRDASASVIVPVVDAETFNTAAPKMRQEIKNTSKITTVNVDGDFSSSHDDEPHKEGASRARRLQIYSSDGNGENILARRKRSHTIATNTPPLILPGIEATQRIVFRDNEATPPQPPPPPPPQHQPQSSIRPSSLDLEAAGYPVRPHRKKTSRSTSPTSGIYAVTTMQPVSSSSGAIPNAASASHEHVRFATNCEHGEKRRDAGAPNEIVACTTCGGSSSPCTHSANNGCATETCFVQVRKKEPPHPIRVAKTIDVIARITFPTAYAIFLIFFFVHYKGFS